MKILENHEVPTGNILVVNGEKGKLECLSLSDYGKNINLKADFLDLKKKPEKVRHTKLLSLQEKWVVTISTQYGCSMNCNFCDVPTVGKGVNATFKDLIKQTLLPLTELHPHQKGTDRLNVHFARMGEPSWNPNVLDAAKWMHTHLNPEYNVHPVVSTMMPKNNEWLKTFIHTWMRIKNRLYLGNAGLQLSINSTNEAERAIMFRNQSLTLGEMAKVMEGAIPVGRKITLNFAVADYEVDPKILLKYFDPDEYLIKLTPMHKTNKATENRIETIGDYTQYNPYKAYEKSLRSNGYDVLVFIASEAEDNSRITCGNAILSGTATG